MACRETKVLPEAGGYFQQSVKMMKAFDIMDTVAERLAKARKRRG